MRKQRLLEIEVPDFCPDFLYSISIIFILLCFTLFFSYVFKQANIQEKIIFGGIITFLIELIIVFVSFLRYPDYFKKILTGVGTFFSGIKYYFLIFPFLIIISSIVFFIFEKLNLKIEVQKVITFYFETEKFSLILVLFLLSCFVAPFTEEIIFRGILYSSLRDKFSSFSGILLSALIFALFHNNIYSFFGIFILGCALAIIFEKHKTLWPSIGLHFFNNFLTNIFILTAKFLNSHS